MAISAHHDDIELSCSGTLMKHVKSGDNVYMLVLSDSGYGPKNGNQIRSSRIAKKEGRLAASIIGANLIEFNIPTFEIRFTDDLNWMIYNEIVKYNIDTVYCHWYGDLHIDHYYAAKSSIMASRHVPNVLMFRSNFYMTPTEFRGNFFVDISDVIEDKMRVIACHESELARVLDSWKIFRENMDRIHGMMNGTEYCEVFEVVRYLVV